MTSAFYCIETRYAGATNTLSNRIVVSSSGINNVRLQVPYNHELSVFDNHRNAANTFAKSVGWIGEWVGGATQKGYAFVRVSSHSPALM